MAKANKNDGKGKKRQHTVTASTLDVPVFITRVTFDGEQLQIGVKIDGGVIAASKVQRELLGAKLEVDLIEDNGDAPGQGKLIDVGELRVSCEAEVNNITMTKKPVGFGFTLKAKMSLKETDDFFRFESRGAKALFTRIGDSGDSSDDEDAPKQTDVPGQLALANA